MKNGNEKGKKDYEPLYNSPVYNHSSSEVMLTLVIMKHVKLLQGMTKIDSTTGSIVALNIYVFSSMGDESRKLRYLLVASEDNL